MERKTERVDGLAISKERYIKHSPCHDCERQSTNNCLEDGCTYGSLLNMLAEYEDTGLTPEEIRKNSIAFGNDRAWFFEEQTKLRNQLKETNKSLLKIRRDRDYWKSEAVKATAELGEIKIAEQALRGGVAE